MRSVLTVLLLGVALHSAGQVYFHRELNIPVTDGSNLQMPWTGGLNFPIFSSIDLNFDGRTDLVAYERSNNRLSTFLNNGQPGTNCWEYHPAYEDFFPEMSGWMRLYDYNLDGNPDIFTSNFTNNGITLYRNDSQNGILQFTLVDSTVKFVYPFGLVNIFASAFLIPDFNDIDGDGDVDILNQQNTCIGTYAFYRNMSIEDYGVPDSLNDYEHVTNSWGHFGLRSGSFRYSRVNNFNVNCPAFQNYSQSSAAPADDTYANIFTIDIDGDGDKDALIGDSQTVNSLLVINGGDPDSAQMISQDTLFPGYDLGVEIESFAAHAYLDADNDNVKDLIVSQSEFANHDAIFFYKNTGTDASPHFSFVTKSFMQDNMIDVGENATAVVFDFDNDGLNDLVIGNRRSTLLSPNAETGLTIYKNTGTATSPAFSLADEDFAGLKALGLAGLIHPAFGDLDDDGDADMIIGEDNGELKLFSNNGSGTFTLASVTYMAIDVGSSATPQLIDVNRDGLLDLLVGQKTGRVQYFQNTGTAGNAFFNSTPTNTTFGNIDVRTVSTSDGYSVPFLFDRQGDYFLLVSCMQGKAFLYGNIDGNLGGTFTTLDTVISRNGGNRFGSNLTIGGGDINGDSLTDFVAGFYGGGIQIFYQGGTTGVAEASVKPVEDVLKVFPQPATGIISVETNPNMKGRHLEIFDVCGKKVFQTSIVASSQLVDLSYIQPGFYILRLEGTTGTRIIISR